MKTAVGSGKTPGELSVFPAFQKPSAFAEPGCLFAVQKGDELKVDIRLPKFVYAGIVKGTRPGRRCAR
jgi:hypothetical protein